MIAANDETKLRTQILNVGFFVFIEGGTRTP
jgi:hypothetical protein